MSRRNRQANQSKDVVEQEKVMSQEMIEVELPREDIEPVADTIETSQEDPVAQVQPTLDEEVDMGEVEVEKELSPLAKTILNAGKQSVEQAKRTVVKTPGVAKTPIFGKRPKGAWPYGRMEIKDRSIHYPPHHQKALILELIEFLGEGATMQKIVEHIESQEQLWMRLKSKQAVYDCVNFHTKDLWSMGVIGAPEIKESKTEDEKDE